MIVGDASLQLVKYLSDSCFSGHNVTLASDNDLKIDFVFSFSGFDYFFWGFFVWLVAWLVGLVYLFCFDSTTSYLYPWV